MNDDPSLVVAGLLLTPLAVGFWVTVIVWLRRLRAAEHMAGFRPTPASVAAIEADLPEMREVTR